MHTYIKRSSGFTLIEVMLALIIFSVIAVSVGRSASIYINNAARLELKTEALIVAESELNLALMDPKFPQSKTTNYDLELGVRHWKITKTVTNTLNPNFKSIDISVSEKGELFGPEYSIINLTGYKGKN